MTKIEDLVPEMAGALAAQESALTNVVATLTTQLQNLAIDNANYVKRVRMLETAQRRLEAANTTLQEQQAEHIRQLDLLRDNKPDLSGFEATFKAQIESQTKHLVASQIDALETKFSAQMEERLLATSNSAFLQAQRAEDTMRMQLELLEKKFEYLSRVKMEIKDLTKRIEKQDQTLDDMQTGISLLVKSVGTDEIDDDSDHEEMDDRNTPPTHSRQSRRKSTLRVAAAVARAVKSDVTTESPSDAVTQLPPPPTLEPVPDNDWLNVTDTPTSDLPTPSDEHTTEEAVSLVEEPVAQPVPPIIESPDETPVVEPVGPIVATTEPDPPAPTTPVTEEPPVETMIVPTPNDDVVDEESCLPQPMHELEQSPNAWSVPADIESVPELPSLIPEPTPVLVVETSPSPESTPETISTEREDSARTEEENDTFPSSDATGPEIEPTVSVPPPVVSSPPVMLQHMATSPNLSAVTYMRSRRQERSAKRQSSSLRKDSTSDQRTTTTHVPLTKDEIRQRWLVIFNKIVQLRRLQTIHGTSAEKSLFRKQNMSMGARVKRLEETSHDLEHSLEMIETTLQTTTQTVDMMGQLLAQQTDVAAKNVGDVQQSLLALEEKVEAVEAEVRRVRTISRRDSSSGNVTAGTIAQIAAQIHELTARVNAHVAAQQTMETSLQDVTKAALPALTLKVESGLRNLHTEMESKTKEIAREITKTIETQEAAQSAVESTLHARVTQCVDQLHGDLLILSSALLFSVDLIKQQQQQKTATRPKTPLSVGIDLLHSIMATFETKCKPLQDTESAEAAAALIDKLDGFRQELVKLKDQYAKAQKNVVGSSSQSTTTTSASFEEHLVLICTTQLRWLEGVLISLAQNTTTTTGHLEFTFLIKDLVVQMRSVLFLLSLHAQLMVPHQHIQRLDAVQQGVQTQLATHQFALGQVGTIEAVVKLMNMRLDAFVDLTLSFAKDEDVKRSIQDVLNANEELREQLTKQVEGTSADAQQRGELLERDVAQLVGRVNKKLDKDELLWTQEVLERRLQTVAQSALGEQDLDAIHRALRTKVDRAQLLTLLQQQDAKLLELRESGTGDGGRGNAPLVATRCISCASGELSSMTAQQLQAAVKDEVARVLAASRPQQQQHAAVSPGPASPSFSVSSHRSMDKHKKELLLASLQQKHTK